MERKNFKRFSVQAEDRGEVEAVFSTFDVVDSDGDVTLPGAFEDGAAVRISAYGHRSWGGELPVGKGAIRAGEFEAVLEGRFFLETTAGQETFRTVKGMGDLQEWSYGYDVVEAEETKRDGQPVRILHKLKVHEVSPVLLGAGVGTRTLAVKDAARRKSDANGDGRGPGDDVVELLIAATDLLVTEGNAIMDAVEPEPDADSELEAEKARFRALSDPVAQLKRHLHQTSTGEARFRVLAEKDVADYERSVAARVIELTSVDSGIADPALLWIERVADVGTLKADEFRFRPVNGFCVLDEQVVAIVAGQGPAATSESVAHEVGHLKYRYLGEGLSPRAEEAATSYGLRAKSWWEDGGHVLELDGEPVFRLDAAKVAPGTIALDRGRRQAWRRTETPARNGAGFGPPGGYRRLWASSLFG